MIVVLKMMFLPAQTLPLFTIVEIYVDKQGESRVVTYVSSTTSERSWLYVTSVSCFVSRKRQ